MKATRSLPENFALDWNLDLKHQTRMNIILQIAGLAWMVVAGWLLVLFVIWLRPDFSTVFQVQSHPLLPALLLLLVIMALVIVLHELVHGLFFWLFTGSRPIFGLGTGYAFAAMPDWFFAKSQYLVIGLSPLVLLTVAGLVASEFVPASWLAGLLAGMVINAGGAIGDIFVCWLILRDPGEVLIRDTGDGFEIFRRQPG